MSQAGYVQSRCCPLCLKDDFEVVESLRNLQFYVDDYSTPPLVTYSQVKCRKCGFIYMNPCYTDEGFSVLFKLAGRSYGDGGGRHDEQIRWLQRNNCISEDNSYMDIGCFEGDFLLAIPKAKELLGIDFDEPAILRAKEKSALKDAKLYSGRFEELDLNRKIDIFTMFHVLEHLPDPIRVLKRLAYHAHNNTKLIIEVPILELGPTLDIHGFYSPQHLSHFSEHTLSNLLLKAGWMICNKERAKDYNGFRICASPTLSTEEGISFNERDNIYFFNEREKYYEARKRIEKCIQAIPDGVMLIIWGAGMHLEMLYQRTSLLNKFPVSKIMLVDSDAYKQDKAWRGLPIKPPKELLNVKSWDNVRLLVSSYGGQESIVADAESRGVPKNCIIRLYQSVSSY